MSEEFSATVPSERAVEQAIVALKKGAHLLKHGRRGKPKFCPFRLSSDEKFLIWYSGEEEKQLKLSLVSNVVRGQNTVSFQRQLRPERESQSFSLIYANGERSLDLICKDKAQSDTWVIGLRTVISRCKRPRSLVGALKNHRGAQSCVNSPAGLVRRKHNLGLLEGTTKSSKVRSLAGSPPHSLAERCFSDGLSCSSDSFYSESSLSSMQNLLDVTVPNSPYIQPEDFKRRERVHGQTENQTNMLSRIVAPSKIEKNVLRDVLIWGEGIEEGCLGGGVDKLDNRTGMCLDALLPKLLESTVMLDVQTLSLGGKHATLVTKQGDVFCWGEGKGGKLGHRVNMDLTCPKIVDSLTGVHVNSVACGEYQTCAVSLSGELYTWGDSYYGCDITSEDRYRNTSQWLPHRLYGPLDGVKISTVACGEWHTAIVSTSGQLFTYGDGTFGVLGHGNTQSFSQPNEVESLKGLWVKSVSCGPWHTAAIVEIMVDRFKFKEQGGKLFTWGDGDKGRLGHPNQEKKLLPTCVAQLVDHDFVRVSCGRMLTVGLTSMGIVYTMGSSVHGQLGNPQAKDKSITVVQGKLKNEFVLEISSGSYHVAVLTSKGSTYTWGKGANGQLGLGDNEDRDSPTLVEALRDIQVENITCGSNSTAAICLHKSISSTDQSACRGCGMAFGFTRKKHNCYNCGLLFCRLCSTKKAINASLAPNKSKPFRVCDPCFNQLERIMHSGKTSKPENRTPKSLFTIKELSDEREDRVDATTEHSQLSCVEDKNCHERKTPKSHLGNHQPVDPISSLLTRFPRWGQVHCPVLFETDCREHPLSDISCPQDIPLGSRSSTSPAMNVDQGLSDSESMLMEEVQKLRAEAESLEMLCQTRGEKIQECKRRIEETWSLAKEEAAKCKAAKDVIKALTLRLHTMSEKLPPENDRVPELRPIHTGSPTLNALNMLVAKHLPPEVGLLEDRKIGSLCSSPIVFTNALKSICERDTYNCETRSTEESRLDSRQNGVKASKLEWVEQYEPGVYITFTTLPSGQKGLKRVRFSRKKFTEKQAQRWWEEKQIDVYQKYDIEVYHSSNHDILNG